MLYLINDKYYMLRNREYVKVDVELRSGELSIKPDRSDVIEVNDNVKAKGVLVDNIIKDLQNRESSHDRDNTRKNKYDM